jgi:LysR family transcriptional activator of mexEF-oprN operon
MFNENELRRFDLNLLWIFTALMNERSATRAADRLGIGGPAVSMALRRLRAELDDPLFIRVGTEFQPTARATEFMRTVGPTLEQIRLGLQGSSSFDPAQSRRTFRIGCSDDIDVILSPWLARSALAKQDGSRYVVCRTEFLVNPILLERDDVDLAIGVVKDLPKWLCSKHVASAGLLCLVDPAHVDLSGKLSKQAYLELPHVIVSSAGGLRGVLDETLSSLRVHRYVAHSTPHFSVVPSILKQGRAVATLPAYVARELALVHGLRCLKPPFEFQRFDIHVVWHRKDDKEAGHQWLRESVSSHLANVVGQTTLPSQMRQRSGSRKKSAS